jgi:transcription elongation factor Elf1
MSEPTQAEVLKSCPFCGGKAYKTESVNGSNMVYVGCGPCGVHFKAQKDGTNGVLSKDVVAYWNTRAAERSLAPATPTASHHQDCPYRPCTCIPIVYDEESKSRRKR